MTARAVLIDEYQLAAVLTAVYPDEYKLVYPALGLVGEAGEVSEKVKKLIRSGQITPGSSDVTPEVRSELAKELGDVLWYLAAVTHDLGLSLSEVAELNIKKLRDRAERGVLDGEGDNR